MDNLIWLRESAARPTDDEGLIYEQVIAKTPDYLVAIYDGATVDAEASARDGRVRYANVPMIAVRCMGETDFVSRPLTADDRRRFRMSVAQYEKRRDAMRKRIALELLPGITPADLAEFAELGINDAAALPDNEVLPANLEQWRTLAKRLLSLGKPRLRLVDGRLEEVAA